MTNKIVVGLALAASAAFAQGGFGNYGYGNGAGKCTVEVEIDSAADVLVTGSRVQLRTLQGGRAQLVRTNCSSPMPFAPAGFRFRGVDGRGRQTLLVDPASNRGTAVVRLEDPRGGRERYTFDLTWNGNNANYNGGYNNPVYGGNGYPVYGNNYPVYGNNYPNNRPRKNRNRDWDDGYRNRRDRDRDWDWDDRYRDRR